MRPDEERILNAHDPPTKHFAYPGRVRRAEQSLAQSDDVHRAARRSNLTPYVCQIVSDRLKGRMPAAPREPHRIPGRQGNHRARRTPEQMATQRASFVARLDAIGEGGGS